MIEVRIGKDHVTVKGHTGLAPEGQDVCGAAMSALFAYLESAVWQVSNVSVSKYKGFASLCLPLPGNSQRLLLKTCRIAVKELIKETPDYGMIV